MTAFEIITIIGSALLIFGAIVGVYVKTVVSITKIQVEIIEMKRDLVQKEIAILLIEKNNRDDFKENREANAKILEKVDKLIETLIK